MIIEEMIRLFIDSRRRGTTGARRKASPATIEFYERHLRVFANFLQTEVASGSVTRYESIRRLHIVQFLDWLDRKQAAGDWTRATVLQTLRTLRCFFRWVDKDEDCQLYELKGLQKYLPTIEKTAMRTDIPQTLDMKKFRMSFNTDNRWQYRDYVAASLMLTNGIRISELCGLKIGDIKFEDKVIIVFGKGREHRLVPITNDMIRLLKGWLRVRENCKTAEGSEFVFVSKYSGKMDNTGFAHRFQKHCDKHGLPRITAHTFRHVFATNYLKQGGDIEKLRNVMGHSSYEILKNYLHMAKLGGKSIQEEVERVNLLKEV
jgi:site-specific recombinase XerD